MLKGAEPRKQLAREGQQGAWECSGEPEQPPVLFREAGPGQNPAVFVGNLLCWLWGAPLAR